MPALSDHDYHLTRAAAERTAAARAGGVCARDAHLALAEQHDERASSIEKRQHRMIRSQVHHAIPA